MNPALLALVAMALRGRVVRSVRMLRQPKYLIGSVIGVGWVLFWVSSSMGNVKFDGLRRLELALEPAAEAGLLVLASALLAAVTSLAWLTPLGRLGLGLKEAELHVLLPAPVSRRQIIQYALLKNQLGVVVTSAVLSFVVGGGSPANRLLTFIALWAIFNAWDLNAKLRGTFLLRQREVAAGTARLRWFVLIATIGLFWALVLPALLDAGSRALVTVSGVQDFDAVVEKSSAGLAALHDNFRGTLGFWLLRPFDWVLGPLFATGFGSLGVALVPVVVLLVVQHELIVRSPARFEETALERAEKETREKSPTHKRARLSARARNRVPFPLDPTGAPEVAVVWKNLLAVTRWPLARIAAATLVSGLVIAFALPLLRVPAFAYFIVLVLAAFGLFAFPFTVGLSWQNDFRTELRHIELVRTWPIADTRLVVAEVASPALLATLIAACCAVLIVAAMTGAIVSERLAGGREMIVPEAGTEILGTPYWLAVTLILCGALPLLGGIAAMSSALQNLVVLFVPAWAVQGKDSAKGMAAFGHRLLFASALGLAFFFAMIPSTLVVALVVVLQWLVGLPFTAWLFPLWGVLGAAPLLIGAWFLAGIAGELWQRLDPAAEILETA